MKFFGFLVLLSAIGMLFVEGANSTGKQLDNFFTNYMSGMKLTLASALENPNTDRLINHVLTSYQHETRSNASKFVNPIKIHRNITANSSDPTTYNRGPILTVLSSPLNPPGKGNNLTVEESNLKAMNSWNNTNTQSPYRIPDDNFSFPIEEEHFRSKNLNPSEMSSPLVKQSSNKSDVALKFDAEEFRSENASTLISVDPNQTRYGQSSASSAWITEIGRLESTVAPNEQLDAPAENNSSLMTTEAIVNGTTEKLCKDISFQEFEDTVRAIGAPVSSSYENLTGIADSVPGDGYGFEYTLTIEIANYMNRSIASFQLLDPHNASYFIAPELIGPNTKEVFTFYEPSCCFPLAAFSFEIIGTNTRLVAYGQSSYFKAIGLAFLPEDVSLQQYYTDKAKFGEYVLMWQTESTKSIKAQKNNFHAKATMSGAFKCVINIEIIELLKC